MRGGASSWVATSGARDGAAGSAANWDGGLQGVEIEASPVARMGGGAASVSARSPHIGTSVVAKARGLSTNSNAATRHPIRCR